MKLAQSARMLFCQIRCQVGLSKSVNIPRGWAQRESGHEDKYCRVCKASFRMESKELLKSMEGCENQNNFFPIEAVFLFVHMVKNEAFKEILCVVDTLGFMINTPFLGIAPSFKLTFAGEEALFQFFSCSLATLKWSRGRNLTQIGPKILFSRTSRLGI